VLAAEEAAAKLRADVAAAERRMAPWVRRKAGLPTTKVAPRENVVVGESCHSGRGARPSVSSGPGLCSCRSSAVSFVTGLGRAKQEAGGGDCNATGCWAWADGEGEAVQREDSDACPAFPPALAASSEARRSAARPARLLFLFFSLGAVGLLRP
jgi:hypothetical protein